jgi:MFS family permease
VYSKGERPVAKKFSRIQNMKKWLVIIILAISQFVMILDSTVMNVSISAVAKDLGTNISGMQAAITFYALTMAALMLTGGKLGDKWGRHNAFKIGSVVIWNRIINNGS